ncbi:hypothetical protein F4802DRAFT_555413 [Xylaria palmicola]|nr:hypothetical protein F4802DRAFT_555413 [Xylaria palmicola]
MAASSVSLHMMVKLSPYVFTHEPSETRPQPAGASDPKLIILAAWMDARDVHIAKYITCYQSLYPGASILLLKFVMKGAMQPAVWHLRSLINGGELSASPARPEILAHVFSNGGATSLRDVYVGYSSAFGQPFPLHCAVFDSCPGWHSFSCAYNALSAGYPRGLARLIAAPFIVLTILVSWVLHNPLSFFAGEGFLSTNARILNDRGLVRQTNRTYIYGNADAVVDWRHIERHAKNATSEGFNVRKEMFENSPHVAHMRTHSQRYWLIVEETWKKATATP